jgi:hypothetical protein
MNQRSNASNQKDKADGKLIEQEPSIDIKWPTLIHEKSF